MSTIVHRNGINQTRVRIGGTVDSPATVKSSARATIIRLTAAATRAVACVPSAARDAVIAAAAAIMASDDRATRGRVWDCHIAAAASAAGYGPAVSMARDGVPVDADVAAWRRAHGLPVPAVASPAAR